MDDLAARAGGEDPAGKQYYNFIKPLAVFENMPCFSREGPLPMLLVVP